MQKIKFPEGKMKCNKKNRICDSCKNILTSKCEKKSQKLSITRKFSQNFSSHTKIFKEKQSEKFTLLQNYLKCKINLNQFK